MANRTGIALGTNLGNRLARLREARDMLLSLMPPDTTFLQSPIYQTEPVGCPPNSPDFYNAVIEIDYIGTPQELLNATQGIEWRIGRTPSSEINAPRVIDLDLLYFGNVVFEDEFLTLPHPRLTHRRFVLQPLTDIRPNLILPGDETTVGEHFRQLDTDEPEPHLIQTSW